MSNTYGPIPHSALAVGDRIAVRRHSGAELTGEVLELGEWHPSCAGSPMRWVTFRTADGAVRTVAESAHRDNEIRVLPPRVCRHEESLYGRCVACGMTWGEQARARTA